MNTTLKSLTRTTALAVFLVVGLVGMGATVPVSAWCGGTAGNPTNCKGADPAPAPESTQFDLPTFAAGLWLALDAIV